jgi:tetratricopeptide (TPR) repeat protein
MSRTLNLVAQLLTRGRKLHQLGVENEALRTFGQLARLGDLESEVAEEVQSRLAEILLRRGKFHRARRHLTAALAHQPDNPHYHHLTATALEADSQADPKRALAHWRRAVELDPTNARYLSAFGLLAVREGECEEGLTALRRAHELASDDPAVLGNLTEGLCHAGLAEEARTALRAALFRNPRDLEIRQLWNDFQFKQLQEQQQAARRLRLATETDNQPALLPFVRPAPAATSPAPGGRLLRRDRPARRMPPHYPNRIPGKKHA